MKRFSGLVLLILTLGIGSAGELADLHQQLTPREGSTENKSGVLAPFPNAVETDIRQIGIERTRCFTGCPAYTFIVQRDGSFRYEGEYGVERLGRHTGTVSVGRLNQVLAFIDEAAYMKFDSTYTTPFLDGPTVYTFVEKEDTTKVIENYANSGPATLWAIEQLIDALLETAEWNLGANEY